MNRLALTEAHPEAGEHLLEVGFGGGELIARLLDVPGVRVSGADISVAMVDRARARFAGKGVTLAQADVERLPFESDSFDVAVSISNLFFWTEPRAALTEIARVLKPGGRLVLCFEPADEMRKWPGHRHGFTLYDPDEVRALMIEAGFAEAKAAWGKGRKPDRFCCLSASLVGARPAP